MFCFFVGRSASIFSVGIRDRNRRVARLVACNDRTFCMYKVDYTRILQGVEMYCSRYVKFLSYLSPASTEYPFVSSFA